MPSWFGRIRDGLARTAQQIRERLGEAGLGEPAPAESVSRAESGSRAVGVERLESLEALEDAMIAADVGLPATGQILDAVRADPRGSIGDRVGRVMRRILTDVTPAPALTTRPHVVLIVGVNGTGKTTTVGKLASWYRSEGKSVLVCAADTFREAAVEQLAVWVERAHVDFIRA